MRYLKFVLRNVSLFVLSIMLWNNSVGQSTSNNENLQPFVVELKYLEEGAVEIGLDEYHYFYVFVDEQENEYQFRKPSDEEYLKILKNKNNYGKWMMVALSSSDIHEAEVLKVELLNTDNLIRIKNSETESINVKAINELYKFKSENYYIRIIVSGSGGATDFGAYRNVFVVFDNGYEMPNRTAVFAIGRIGYLNDVTMTSESEIVLNCEGYGQELNGEDNMNVSKIIINISEVLKKEKAFDKASDYFEGSINSHVLVGISEE